ncbi:MAG TPA: cupredoxin domain-containing protein [Solirubrobacteraceae bacterium]|jgi:uncharacterized cupredoxin-like copper-binding protein|nr:cupredoxin domain-containing protein [Solirubrobacteraceae bacterium]
MKAILLRTSLVVATCATPLAIAHPDAFAWSAANARASGTAVVNVKLSDFKVAPSVKSVKAGKVTFVVKNAADMDHELVVIKTTRKAAKLPMSGGRASEKGSVGEAEDIAGGKTKRLTLTLKKGHYALICNIGGHYVAGMHADFTVS